MATQGIWFNLLLVMWDEKEQGKIRGSKEEICQLIGCKISELERFFKDNKAHVFCNVTFRNKKVTIINRRMYKKYIEREGIKKRVSKHRKKEKRKCNTDVTPYSSTSTSLKDKKDVTSQLQFEQARKQYPGTKRGLQTEYKNFQKHKDWQGVLPLLLPAVEHQAQKWRQEGTLKKYIPHFKTWINNRQWEQSTGQIITYKQKAEDEQQAFEKERQRIRDEDSQYFREHTTDELKKMLKSTLSKFITRRWLIKEILQEREED
jgi:hypothetical protein